MVDSTTSGCGLIFMNCDGLMLVGGSNYGLILVSTFWVLVMVGGGSGLVG